MSYATLTADKDTAGSIKEWVNNSTIPSASIVSKAEAMLYQHMRVREMKAVATGTIALDATTIDLSALTMQEPINLRTIGDSGSDIAILDEEHWASRTHVNASQVLDEGQPSEAMVLGDTVYLNYKSDAAYEYRLTYFRRLPALSATDTNFLTSRYPHILEAACFYWAYSFMKDRQEADHWLQVTMASVDKANEEYGMYMGQIRFEKYWNEG